MAQGDSLTTLLQQAQNNPAVLQILAGHAQQPTASTPQIAPSQIAPPPPNVKPPPAKRGPKGGAKQPAEVSQPFDLTSAINTAAQPTYNALFSALGIQPGQQASAQSIVPGLDQYLKNVPQNIKGTITGGLNNVAQAEQGMVPSLDMMFGNQANAGLLTDLLNAARYQAIYKQSLYGQPQGTDAAGQPDPLSQLFARVSSGTSVIPGGVATNPFGSPGAGTKSPTNAAGSTNPYSTVKPPQV